MKNSSLIALIIAVVISTVQTVHADETYFVHTDHINTPTLVTDQSKSVVWKADREPFGKTTEVVSTIDMPIRFPGQYFDKETGLHYNFMRDYDSRLGRYVQSDPIGLLGGLNTYGYAGLNPLMHVDPEGTNYLKIIVLIWKLVVGNRGPAKPDPPPPPRPPTATAPPSTPSKPPPAGTPPPPPNNTCL